MTITCRFLSTGKVPADDMAQGCAKPVAGLTAILRCHDYPSPYYISSTDERGEVNEWYTDDRYVMAQGHRPDQVFALNNTTWSIEFRATASAKIAPEERRFLPFILDFAVDHQVHIRVTTTLVAHEVFNVVEDVSPLVRLVPSPGPRSPRPSRYDYIPLTSSSDTAHASGPESNSSRSDNGARGLSNASRWPHRDPETASLALSPSLINGATQPSASDFKLPSPIVPVHQNHLTTSVNGPPVGVNAHCPKRGVDHVEPDGLPGAKRRSNRLRIKTGGI